MLCNRRSKEKGTLEKRMGNYRISSNRSLVYIEACLIYRPGLLDTHMEIKAHINSTMRPGLIDKPGYEIEALASIRGNMV